MKEMTPVYLPEACVRGDLPLYPFLACLIKPYCRSYVAFYHLTRNVGEVHKATITMVDID